MGDVLTGAEVERLIATARLYVVESARTWREWDRGGGPDYPSPHPIYALRAAVDALAEIERRAAEGR